jgi:hypothetical protein
VRRAWTSKVASHVGRKRGGAGIGELPPREIEQLLALLVAEATQLEPLEARAHVGRVHSGPVGELALPRRPCSGQ